MIRPAPPRSDRRLALRVSVVYATFAALWILASDRALEFLVTDATTLSRLQTYKGWTFVVITAALLYLLIRRFGYSSIDPGAPGRAPEDRRMGAAVVVAAGFLIAAIMANLVHSLVSERSDLIEEAEQSTRNLAQVIEEQTGAQFNAIDLTLRAVARDLDLLPGDAPGRAATVHAILREDLRALPFVRALFIVDAQGRAIHGSESLPALPLDGSDRDYFRVHSQSADAGLHIGRPLQSRASGQWFVSVSRRLVDRGGTFAGVVVAAYEPQYLQRFFTSIRVGRSGSVALFLADGTMLARVPQADGVTGRNFAGTPLMAAELPRAREGTYHTRSTVDGVERIFSYRTVAGRPLVVLVGAGRDEVLAKWRVRAWTYGAVSVAFMLLIAWTGGMVTREFDRRSALLAALRASEQRFSLIFHANPAAQSIAELREGGFIDINERCAQLFGYAREEMLGRSSRELGMWPDPDERDRLVERAIREGMLRDVPLRLAGKDGRPHDLLLSVVVTRVVGRDEPVLIALYHDVTDLFRAQAELVENERRYRLLFEANPHAMWVYDHETMHIVAVNDEAVATYGYTREEFLAMSVLDFRPEEDRERLWTRNRSLDPVARRESIWRHRKKSGELIDVEVVSHGLIFDGRPARLALATNVTEKLAAERALSESERLNRAVQHSLEDGILLRDAGGRVRLANPAAARMYATTVERIVGEAGPIERARFYFENGEPQSREQAAWYNTLQDGRARQGLILRLVRQDGTEIWVEAAAAPLFRDGDARPYGVVTKITDITMRRVAEAEVRRLNAELEDRVARRTAELQAANRELESFAYTVSHDLRAPLRHLDGFAALARESLGSDDAATRQHLEAVARSARRMGALVDGLLELSRTGRAELAIRVVELGPLVADVREECARDAGQRAVDWRIAALPAVRGDPDLLRQAFVNLIGNAVKFSARRAVAIIEVFAEEGAAGETVIAVRDNGAGFDMRYAEHLFDAFQRLHGRDEFEGTGIGLATVRRVVERHGGRIWVEAVPDDGATFRFTLPPA